MSEKADKALELRLANFRKLFLEKSKDESRNWTITDQSRDENYSDSSMNWLRNSLEDQSEYIRATAELGTDFAIAFTVLGFITLFINLLILAILLSHRRLLLQQVFYLLIINFAIIDCLKGACLASHALRFIIPPSVYEDRKVLATRIDQYVVNFFRLFNLETVFNLLMITLNEFIYIKFPLRYHQLITRRAIFRLVCVTWLISICFTIASSLAKTKEETVFVSTDSNDNGTTEVNYKNRNLLRHGTSYSEYIDLHTIFTFALTGFCIFSLLVVLICYLIFFVVIRKIHKYDRKLLMDANSRRTSEASVECSDFQHLDERKIKRQLLRRYKYVLVIGSVILVYMLYLISYSSIQVLQHFNLSGRPDMRKMRSMLITRWILVLLCGLHSSIQPICYFRMKEFREIVIRVFGYPCKREFRSGGAIDRSEYLSSAMDVSPLTTNNCPTPHVIISNQRYANSAATLGNGYYQNDLNDQLKSSLRRKPTDYTRINGIRSGRQQSVVHFEEGNLLVSTLCRKQSGLADNEL